ncbi:MAG: YciI family protein [Devosia sp.]
MRYICLVHFEASKLTDAPLDYRQDIDRRSLAHDEELKRQGHYIVSQAIQQPDTAVLVRVRNGKMSTTDGPYIETKEAMAGFILVEARDMNEAIRIAGDIPLAEIGTIEVRPIYEIPLPPAL